MNGLKFLLPLRAIVLILAIVAGLPGMAGGIESQSTVESKEIQAVDECGTPGVDWVFCCGFEEGNFNVWDDYDGNPEPDNVILENGGPLDISGNHVARLRVPPGRGGADLVKVLPDSYDRLYARWYVMWEPGYDFNAPSHGSGLFAGEQPLLGRSGFRPDGTDWFISSLEARYTTHRMAAYTYYRGMYQDCADPEGSCWGDEFPCTEDEGQVYCEKPQHRDPPLPPIIEAGRWYCIEIMMDGGTPVDRDDLADGILDYWIDGVEMGPWTDLWLRTTPDLKLSILWLCLFHHGEHSVEGIMIDNVVVSTSRIGCLLGDPNVPTEKSSWGSLKSLYR